jgi:hypothetical protein
MTESAKKSVWIAALCFALCVPMTGCDATNDNPINPDKMNQIRQKESRDRANFNPSTAPPGSKQ